MNQRYRRSTFAAGGDHDEPQSSSETGAADSPLSGEDTRATNTTTSTTTSAALSPKKGRRSIQKRVVSIPIGDVEGSRSSSKGEAYPPSDSWAWRKYGQKPIKGSPYPRGYYRCSSSKGCPARKQVERSRVDPTTLLITYAAEHNHPVPTTKHHHSSAPAAAAAAPSSPATPILPEAAPDDADVDVETDAAAASEEFPSEDRKELLACAAELGLGGAVLMEFSWLYDVVKEAPSFVGPSSWEDEADVSVLPRSNVNMREEDESLFADLDELPECSAVFKSRRGTSMCNLRPVAPAPLCGSTG